jgi:hypothetical protein
MITTKVTYKVVISIRSGRMSKEREEVDYDTFEKASKFATSWFAHQCDWAQNGFKVSVSIMPIEEDDINIERQP